MPIGPKIKSRAHTFSTDLRHISVQHRKRFVSGVQIYVTRTHEINQNGSRNALVIEQAPYLKTRVTAKSRTVINRDWNLQGNSRKLVALNVKMTSIRFQ